MNSFKISISEISAAITIQREKTLSTVSIKKNVFQDSEVCELSKDTD